MRRKKTSCFYSKVKCNLPALALTILLLTCFFIRATESKAQAIVTAGTGTSTTSQPFNTYYHDSRTQWIILASELTAGGATAGNITQIGFNVSSNAAQTMNGFNIKMQNTASTTLSSGYATGLTTVYSANYAVPGTGWQMITLTTPFNWNGTSNLLIEICFDNSSYTSASTVYYTSASSMVYYGAQDGVSGCSMSGSLSSNRPNTRLYMAGTPPPAGCINTTNSFYSTTAPSAGSSTSNAWQYASYYCYWSSCVAGITYTLTSTVATDYLTVTQGSYNGTIVAAGVQPLSFPCASAGTYYVHTNTNSSCGTQSSYRTITMTRPGAAAPANDVCASATSLPCGTTNLAGTTVGCVNETAPGTCVTGYGVWYTFTGDGTSTTISSVASFDQGMYIGYGTCGSRTQVACVDAAGSGGTETSTFTSTNGTTYYVYIAGYTGTTTGTFTISRSCAGGGPTNDACASATSLPCGTTNLAGTTVGCVNETAPGTCVTGYGVWYTFTGDGTSTTISSVASFDQGMYIGYGTCGSRTQVACVDAAGSGGTETSTFTSTNGTTYYVYIAGYTGTTTGTFTISRSCAGACTPPTTNAAAPTYTNNTTGTSLTVNWTGGNGNGSLVVARLTTTAEALPVSGTNYTANATFGSGSQIGTGNWVVYKGNLQTAAISGLTCNTDYTFTVYEYATTGTCFKIPGSSSAVTTAACGCTPPTTNAAAPTYTNNTTGNSLTVSWTGGNGNGSIVVARLTATANVLPSSGTTYTANAAFGSGQTTGTGNYVVYAGSGSTVNVTGLTCNTSYTFLVYEYNTTGMCYKTPGSSSAVTTAACPADPCASVTSIGGCGPGYPQSFSGGGTGVWASNPCYSSPGTEKIYSYVAPTTGTYSIQVTAASGYMDYNWQASSCGPSGWTCIQDVTSTGNYGSMSWTGGTTYYILLDDEDGTTGTHTFYISSNISTPTANSATNITCNSFSANWSSVSGATKYYLDVSTDWLFGSFVSGYNNLDVGNVLTYTVNSGLSPSTTYYYRVRAYNGCGTSASSSYQSLSTSGGLSAPSINTATNITCNSFDARWNTVSGATKYYLDVSTNSSFSSFVSGYNNLDVGLVLTYQVNSGLNPSTTYYYRVRAYNACGISTSSSYSSPTTSSVATPTKQAESGVTCNSFNANWATYTDATKYYLDVSTDWQFGSFVTGYNNLDVGLVTTYAVNTNLNSSSTYYYRIRALSSCGTSPSSSYETVYTSAGLSAPSIGTETNITCSSFSANWSTVGGATKYYLDVSTDWQFGNFVTGYNNLDVGLVLTYSVTGLNSGSTYYYRVRAYNSCGSSSSSSYQTVYTSSGLSAPSTSSATNEGCTSFSANWATVTGATKYYLDVSTDWQFLSFVTGYNNLDVGNVLTYSVTGLTASSTYYYRVRAWNASCNSSPNSFSETAYTVAAPSAPTANAAINLTCDGQGFRARWQSVFDATSYKLDVSLVSNFASFVGIYNNLDVGNVTGYNVTGLTPSTTYYYRVRAYNGCTSANSSTITVTTSAVGSAPANDECANATTLTVGTSCNLVQYTNKCATNSSQTAPLCGNYNGADVWFKATMPASGNLNVITQEAGMYNGAMAAYSGACGGLTLISCNDDYASVIHVNTMPEIRIRNAGLAGQVVYIRMWSEGGNDDGTFKICAYEPDAPTPCNGNPVPDDVCANATPICEAQSYCGNTGDYYSRDLPGNMCEGCGLFDGSIENNSWLSFTANATSASAHVVVSNCSAGIQMGIYSATNCTSFSLLSNISYTSVWGGQFDFNISVSSLTPGTKYYIMIDGYAGDVCDYSITPVSGISVINAGPDICSTGPVQLNSSGGTSYAWTPTSGLSNPNIANPIATPGTTQTYTVTSGGSNPLCPIAQDDVTIHYYDVSLGATSESDITCQGADNGSVTVLASGGAGSYTYEWNTAETTPAISGLTPGTYTVTATNSLSGCTETIDVIISEPPGPVTINATPDVCDCDGAANGEITVNITNGTGPYMYTWSSGQSGVGVNQVTGLAPGNYNVTVTDNSGPCTVNTTTPISVTYNYETGNNYKWRGKVDIDWNKPVNWCRDGVDVPNNVLHNVLIPAGTPFICNIPNDGIAYQVNDITINGTLVELGSNSKLKVGGEWLNNGTFTENSGLITFNGSVTKNIGGTNPTTFGNLEIDKATATATMLHDIIINMNLTLTSGTLDATASNKNINIKGNWINNGGTYTPYQASVIFDGSAPQSVKSNANSFANVEILNTVVPNATDGVVLNDDMPVGSVLTLTDGSIITGSNKVIISGTSGNKVLAGAGNTGYTNSWIFGNIRRNITVNTDAYDFPVGNDTKSFLAVIKNNSSFSDIDYIDAFFDYSPAALTTSGITNLALAADGGTYKLVSDGGIWVLTPENGTDKNYDLTLYFNNHPAFTDDLVDLEFGILSRTGLNLTSPSEWNVTNLGTLEANTGRMVADGFAYRKGLTTFSHKGIGKLDNTGLPVELFSFDAKCKDGEAFISWSTSSETDNDYFSVEKSQDGFMFETFAVVDGAGNSNTLLNYEVADPSPYNDITYYCLKQTDFNGAYTKSEVIAVECESNGNGFELGNIFLDNAGANILTISFTSVPDEDLSLEVLDLLGQSVFKYEFTLLDNMNDHKISLPELNYGIYFMILSSKSKYISWKILLD